MAIAVKFSWTIAEYIFTKDEIKLPSAKHLLLIEVSFDKYYESFGAANYANFMKILSFGFANERFTSLAMINFID